MWFWSTFHLAWMNMRGVSARPPIFLDAQPHIMRTASDELAFVENADELLAECYEVLRVEPDLNHDVLQILTDISRQSDFLAPPYHFFLIRRDKQVLGCGVNLSPDGLVLSNLPAEAAPLVVEAILRCKIKVKRLAGPPKIAGIVTECLSKRFEYHVSESVRWTMGRLDSPRQPLSSLRGTVRRASSTDAPLIDSWAREYSKERPAFLDILNFMRLKLAEGDLFLWDDKGPRSLATVSGRTQLGARLSSVFTPAKFRGQGYASGIVSELCAHLLKSGHEFVLLTWRSGADEARIYKRLGFVRVAARHAYIFEDRSSTENPVQ